jgi:hypothetical protein
MRRTLIAVAGLVAFAALAETATARDGCGRGWYFNGQACVPMGGETMGAPNYAGPNYAAPNYAAPAYGRPIYGQNSYGQPEIWFPAVVDRYGRPGCAQPGYTVQDGVCKRFRGY